jgi:hypothetical protein
VARGDAFVTGAPGVSVGAFGRCSHACDEARYSLSPGHRAATCENTSSPAWKTCRLVRSMRRVTCCPASGLPSQIWRPAANMLPLAGTTPTYSSPSCRTRLEPERTGGPCILGSTAPPAGRVNAHVRQTLPLRPRLRILGAVDAINKSAHIAPVMCRILCDEPELKISAERRLCAPLPSKAQLRSVKRRPVSTARRGARNRRLSMVLEGAQATKNQKPVQPEPHQRCVGALWPGRTVVTRGASTSADSLVGIGL